MSKNTPLSLSKELEGKFKMAANCAPGKYHFKGETIDTSSCDLETAEAAYKAGFDVIVPVKADAKNTVVK